MNRKMGVIISLLFLLMGAEVFADWRVTYYDGKDEMPAIAWNGNYYLIVWQRENISEDTVFVYGQRVTSARTFVGDEIPILGVVPGPASYNEKEPEVASGDSKWLVVWWEFWGSPNRYVIRGRIVNNDGSMGEIINIATNSSLLCDDADVAWNGVKWLVVWEQYASGEKKYIEGRFVHTDGSMGTPFEIERNSNYYRANPKLAACGSNFFVAWEDVPEDGVYPNDRYNIFGKGVDNNGNLGPRVEIFKDNAQYVHLDKVSASNNYFLVVYGPYNNPNHVCGRRVNSAGTGTVGANIVISSAEGSAECHGAAWTGSNFHVVYRLGWSPIIGIYCREVNEDGSLGSEFQISEDFTSPHWYISNAQGDTNCLNVWDGYAGDNYDIYTDGTGQQGIEEQQGIRFNSVEVVVYPNPFRSNVIINYALSSKHYAQENKEVPTAYSLLPTIRIYDAGGRLVKDFSRATPDALRSTQITWDGTDDFGRELSAGIYFVRFETEDYRVVKKAILLK